MKKITVLSLSLLLSVTGFSQNWIQDSVSVGTRAANHVFYSLSDQTKTVVDANSWHLAFSVQPSAFPNNTLQGTTIRTNNGKRVRIFETPFGDSNNFNLPLDTAGILSWKELIDSDSTWDIGAFNNGLDLSLLPHQGGPDYGWGAYSSDTKGVESKGKVYVVTDNFNSFVKKLYIKNLAFDTAFNFTYANLDNSDSVSSTINKKAYNNKFFVYYNLKTNEILDFEPAKNNWDIVFTDYYTLATSSFGPPQRMSVTGVLHKKGIEVARATDDLPDNVSVENRNFKKDINHIGYDWKAHVGQGVYVYPDSLTYLIRVGDKGYKMHFTRFGGVNNGAIVFNLMALETLSTLTPNNLTNGLSLYPNPTSSNLQIDNLQQDAAIQIVNLSGQIIKNIKSSSNSENIDLTALQNGIYFVKITQNNSTSTHKIIKTN